jgi:hypothetical protein
MKYRKLPIEAEIAAIPETERAARVGAYLVETMSTKGFQLVTGVLQKLEARALLALRTGQVPPERMGLVAGRLQCIEEIRRSLQALLPVPQQPNVDWFDDEEEAFVNVDDSPPR